VKGVERESVSVVVLGRFNPAIFSPAWLRLRKLIGQTDSDQANLQVILPVFSSFSTDWFQLQAREDLLQLSTSMVQDFDRLRDLAVGILTVLGETPVHSVGINREIHWLASSVDAYHVFGDALAPKEFWGKELKLPGTQTVAIQATRPDLWAGWIQVTVQPSAVVRLLGIFAQYNDHYWLKRVSEQPNTRSDFEIITEPRGQPVPSNENIPLALEILGEGWADRMDAAERLLTDLMALT
jgi:hypothetical protein